MPLFLSSSGGVSSVGLSGDGVLHSVSGSPVTTSGTMALGLLAQAANVLLAGPASGGNATPTMRALALADLPAGVAQLAAANTFTASQTVSAPSASVLPLTLTTAYNADVSHFTRSGGTGALLVGTQAGPGSAIALTGSTTANTYNTDCALYQGTGTYAHTGSFGLGRGLDVAVTNNTGATGTLYGALIAATANTAGATAVGLSVTAASSGGTVYAGTFMGGGVGIGTTTPTTTLDVSGTGRFTGALTAQTLSISPTTTTSAPAGGAAGAVPSQPTGWMTITVGGTARQVPYW